MTEDFLHYIWNFQQYDHIDLKTADGAVIEVLDKGYHNSNAGPDFLNAQIRIDNTLWAGNVEIHTAASHWKLHKHHLDKAYDNVILHVVFTNDNPVKSSENTRFIPTLSLARRIDIIAFRKYKAFLKSKSWIPCENHMTDVPEIIKISTISRMLADRLEIKSAIYNDILNICNGDLEEAFYRSLARNMGFKVNSIPFEQLANSTPLKVLLKVKEDIFKMEALLFGQAGFLDDEFEEEYPKTLKTEYHFLQKKFNLVPLRKSSWKFLRLRPQNFPVLRIAQFCRIIGQSFPFVNSILEERDIRQIKRSLMVELNSDYWLNHYNFNKASESKKKSLAESSADILIINTVVPFLFAWSNYSGNLETKERALRFLEEIKPEKNNIITKWKNMNVTVRSAFDSQGLIHLKNEFCIRKNCLNCPIGTYIFKGDKP